MDKLVPEELPADGKLTAETTTIHLKDIGSL